MNNNALIIEIADQQAIEVDPKLLIPIVRKILNDHDFQRGEISIALVDDAQIREINNHYLQHDYETDVISFVLESDQESGLMVAQLVVSTETAQRVAAELGQPFQRELALYAIHGTLHLAGFDDATPEQQIEMRKHESRYLDAFFDQAPGTNCEPSPRPDGAN